MSTLVNFVSRNLNWKEIHIRDIELYRLEQLRIVYKWQCLQFGDYMKMYCHSSKISNLDAVRYYFGTRILAENQDDPARFYIDTLS